MSAGGRARLLPPGMRTGRPYSLDDLRRDVLAGVVLSALLVPAGMGYAEVAGLPPSSGLHATVAALVVYAFLGPSRILVIGPDSALAPLIAAAILPLGGGNDDRLLGLAGLLALLTGVFLLGLGALRLGWIAALISKPIRIGYLNGVALVVIVGQLPQLLGFSVEADDLFGDVRGALRGIRDGELDGAAAGVGLAALALILVQRVVAPRLPGMLLAVVGAGAAVWALGLDIAVIGAMPRGLPSPALDGLRWVDVTALAPAAAGIVLVALADTTALTRVLGTPTDQGNREMAALGATNLAAGLFGGFPVSGSASRTPAARESGARTQVAPLVGGLVVAALLLVAPELTQHVPRAALAAVVIAAVLKLADVRGALVLWRMSRSEFALGLAAFLGVTLVGVLEGIAIAAGLSIAAFVARAWRPHMTELVRIEGRKGYHDVARHPNGDRIPGLLIIRFDAPLFFANGEAFARFVRESVDASDDVRWVAIAAEPVTDVDTTAAEALVALDDELHERGIRLVLAELKGPVKDRLARFGLEARFRGRHYPTLGTAVNDYVDQTGTDYTDWTDR